MCDERSLPIFRTDRLCLSSRTNSPFRKIRKISSGFAAGHARRYDRRSSRLGDLANVRILRFNASICVVPPSPNEANSFRMRGSALEVTGDEQFAVIDYRPTGSPPGSGGGGQPVSSEPSGQSPATPSQR